MRYYPPSGDLYFDVLTRLGEAASFETVEADTKTFEGIHVRVATPAALYRLKRDTVRPLDRQDAEALRQRFGLKDATWRADQGPAVMPVQKFRSVEEMDRAQAIARTADINRFLRHCARYLAIAPRAYPRGVFRFRTLEEAQAARNDPARAASRR